MERERYGIQVDVTLKALLRMVRTVSQAGILAIDALFTHHTYPCLYTYHIIVSSNIGKPVTRSEPDIPSDSTVGSQTVGSQSIMLNPLQNTEAEHGKNNRYDETGHRPSSRQIRRERRDPSNEASRETPSRQRESTPSRSNRRPHETVSSTLPLHTRNINPHNQDCHSLSILKRNQTNDQRNSNTSSRRRSDSEDRRDSRPPTASTFEKMKQKFNERRESFDQQEQRPKTPDSNHDRGRSRDRVDEDDPSVTPVSIRVRTPSPSLRRRKSEFLDKKMGPNSNTPRPPTHTSQRSSREKQSQSPHQTTIKSTKRVNANKPPPSPKPPRTRPSSTPRPSSHGSGILKHKEELSRKRSQSSSPVRLKESTGLGKRTEQNEIKQSQSSGSNKIGSLFSKWRPNSRATSRASSRASSRGRTKSRASSRASSKTPSVNDMNSVTYGKGQERIKKSSSTSGVEVKRRPNNTLEAIGSSSSSSSEMFVKTNSRYY